MLAAAAAAAPAVAAASAAAASPPLLPPPLPARVDSKVFDQIKLHSREGASFQKLKCVAVRARVLAVALLCCVEKAWLAAGTDVRVGCAMPVHAHVAANFPRRSSTSRGPSTCRVRCVHPRRSRLNMPVHSPAVGFPLVLVHPASTCQPTLPLSFCPVPRSQAPPLTPICSTDAPCASTSWANLQRSAGLACSGLRFLSLTHAHSPPPLRVHASVSRVLLGLVSFPSRSARAAALFPRRTATRPG